MLMLFFSKGDGRQLLCQCSCCFSQKVTADSFFANAHAVCFFLQISFPKWLHDIFLYNVELLCTCSSVSVYVIAAKPNQKVEDGEEDGMHWSCTDTYIIKIHPCMHTNRRDCFKCTTCKLTLVCLEVCVDNYKRDRESVCVCCVFCYVSYEPLNNQHAMNPLKMNAFTVTLGSNQSDRDVHCTLSSDPLVFHFNRNFWEYK